MVSVMIVDSMHCRSAACVINDLHHNILCFVLSWQIPQRYEVFEELCNKLSQKFPSVVFDPPPKKAFLINDTVISERRQYMEEVLQKIAKTPKLACSSLVLEFLGAKRGHKEINRLEETQSNIKVLHQ